MRPGVGCLLLVLLLKISMDDTRYPPGLQLLGHLGASTLFLGPLNQPQQLRLRCKSMEEKLV